MNNLIEAAPEERGIRVAASISAVLPSAQEPKPVYAGWQSITSQSEITALALDRSGRIWAGTGGGVLLWDKHTGGSYLRFGPVHGLGGSAVSCLTLDRNELPWVGHPEGGLSRFDGQRWWPYTHLQQEPVRAIAAAAQFGLWVATEAAIYLLPLSQPGQNDPEPIKIAGAEATEAVDAQALLDDGDGVYLGNSWGLFRLSAQAGVAPQVILSVGCNALVRDTQRHIWAGTLEGITCIDKPKRNYAPPIIQVGWRVLGLAVGRNRIWALTLGWPTNRLAQVTMQMGDWQWLDPLPDAVEPIRTIAALPSDARLWLGTDRQIMYVEPQPSVPLFWSGPVLAEHQHDKLSNLAQAVIGCQDSPNVLIGTQAGLLELTPGEERLNILLQDDTHLQDNIHCLAQAIGPATPTRASTIWVARWPSDIVPILPLQLPVQIGPDLGLVLAIAPDTAGHLHVLTTHGLRSIANLAEPLVRHAPPYTVHALVQTSLNGSSWWAATSQGLYRWRAGDSEWTLEGSLDGPGQSLVSSLLVHAASGVLWVATDTGLWVWNGIRWTPRTLPLESHSIELPLRALAAAADNWFWLADAQGVIHYNSLTGETRERFTPFNSGLGSRRVVALLQHAGYLWVITQAGISYLALQKEE